MSRIIIDTSAYSAFMRGDKKVRSVLQTSEAIFLNPVVIGELMSGFISGKRASHNREELDIFLSSPRVRTISIDQETSDRYAAIVYTLRTQGTPLPTNDIWIAASAMQYGLKILTLDDHYLNIPQVIVIN